MTGIKVMGLEELRRNVERLAGVSGIEALQSAQDSAAKVIRDAVKASAPRGETGQLSKSVKIFKSKPKGLSVSSTTAAVRILIGPEKKKGYYGFFLAKGWRTPLGNAQAFTTRRGRSFTTRRIARTATGSAHSQRGLTESKTIPAPYPEWVERAGSSVEQQAMDAWVKTYTNKLKESGIA